MQTGKLAEHDLHHARIAHLEESEGAVLALSSDYPDGHHVPEHRHSRSQLMYALSGVVMVSTGEGRFMVPPEHAVWLPANLDHAVEMLGDVEMRSIYVMPGAIGGLPEDIRVFAVTDLARSLIVEAVKLPPPQQGDARAALVFDLLLHEIPQLPERPLALPLPSDPRLSALCRTFLEKPSARATIDAWARASGMSRRTFTRVFQRETGLSLSTWRQQACLFAALPRLTEGEAVTSVALDLGYESVAAFTTMFKRMLGRPPSRLASAVPYPPRGNAPGE
ncbi:helix-turn-helix transcriptional regulator [Chelativorans sp. AA-79]|uniref:AraC family transcriptional regulator n=1 Tax=Chelativorans sp. AA-79 TaxID=3028735 RepID=UPI0023F627A5|nr:helix-turn-helix transcriptional regulator [Chelativorans sp. AA-79]WEX08209.1 helix-turn-helix transcriptional regulator [Chelativorans sp. AA-79]